MAKQYNDEELAVLWVDFADIPLFEDSDDIEISFMHFSVGTNRFEIWHYFDENHSKGISYLTGVCGVRNE